MSTESNKQIHDFLLDHPVGVLSTVDSMGNPHGVVIYFAIDQGFNITFTTKTDTKKNHNIENNSRIVLISFDAASQTTVQINGFAEKIEDKEREQKAYHDTFMIARHTSDSGRPPISKLYAGQYIAYMIKPIEIRMAIFARPDPGGYDTFETITFTPQSN